MRKLSLLLTLVSLMACRSSQEATQTIIKIRATPAMQERIASYKTQVFRLPDNQMVIQEQPQAVSWPVKRTFVPESKTSSHSFRYVFTALDASEEPVSTLDITTEIVPGASRYLNIVLSEDCLAAKCNKGVCEAAVEAAGLRTSADQAQALESSCSGGSVSTPPVTDAMNTGTSDVAGSDAPTGNTMTGMPGTAGVAAAADGGMITAPGVDAQVPTTPPSTEAECAGNPCVDGQGECHLNGALPLGYECVCASGFERNEAGSTCVERDDCAKPDKGGCEDVCERQPGGEAKCSCEGSSRWLKADGKQCAELQEAVELTTSGGSVDRTRPQVAFDRAGNGVVVWAETSPETAYSLWTARFRADTKEWEPARRFMPGTNEAADLHLALDASGSGVMMWSATVAQKRQLWFVRYRDGAFGRIAYPVDSTSEGDMLTPSLALDGVGDGLAVWTDMLWPNSKLRVARYSASSDTFMVITNVRDSTDLFVMGTSVAVNSLMGGFVAWTEMPVEPVPDAAPLPDVTKPSALSSRVESTLAKGISFAPSGMRSTSPDVVLDEQGNGIAVWVEGPPSSARVVSSNYVPGMGWGSRSLHTLSERGGMFSAPRVVMGADGTSFATWTESTGAATSTTEPTAGPRHTYGAMRTADGFGMSYELGAPSDPAYWNDIDAMAWTPETTVTLLDQLQPSCSIAVGPDRTGFIAGASLSTSASPATRELWFQRIGVDAEPGERIPLSDGDSVPSRPSPVKLGMNANGDGAVVWDQQVDGRYHVFVNLLD